MNMMMMTINITVNIYLKNYRGTWLQSEKLVSSSQPTTGTSQKRTGDTKFHFFRPHMWPKYLLSALFIFVYFHWKTNQYIYVFLTLTLEWGKWPTSYHSCFTPGGKFPSTHWIKGWKSPRACMDISVEKKISCPCLKSNSRPYSPQPNLCTNYTIPNTNPNNFTSSESNHNSVCSDKTQWCGFLKCRNTDIKSYKTVSCLGKEARIFKTCGQWF